MAGTGDEHLGSGKRERKRGQDLLRAADYGKTASGSTVIYQTASVVLFGVCAKDWSGELAVDARTVRSRA